MIRDRKMYVVPTPFALTSGTIGAKTLILPDTLPTDERFVKVGDLVRIEAPNLVTGYSLDLRNNSLVAETIPNPDSGQPHHFCAYRLRGQGGQPVSIDTSSLDSPSDVVEDEAGQS